MDLLNLAITFVDKYLQAKEETLSTNREKHRRNDSVTDDEEPEIIPNEILKEGDFLQYVRYVDDRFSRGVPFIRNGLRASARAAEFPSLGILATILEAIQ